MHVGTNQRSCPQCGTQVPVVEGFVTWCHSCGWNLASPNAYAQVGGRLGPLIERIGRRLGDRLSDELARNEALEPRWTVSKALAYAIAAGVYVGTALLAIGGIALIVLAFPNPFAIVVGVLLISLAILMRPRFGQLPDENVVEEGEAPRLRALVAEVAAALETPNIHVLQVEPEFNASWATLGVRRRRVLRLGLPLLAALDPQERVALIAHELAHGRNGDSTRSFVVGSALRGLEELYALLAPNESLYEVENPDLGPIERLANWMLWLLSRPVLGLLYLQLHLLLRDSQRAEYLADALSARVAGSGAVIALQEKLLLASTFEGVVQHAARPQEGEIDLFEQLTAAVHSVPDRERERRRRAARLEHARLSSTHPPTAKRIALIEARPRAERVITLDEAGSREIDQELAPRRRAAQRDLIDDYRDSLYER